MGEFDTEKFKTKYEKKMKVLQEEMKDLIKTIQILEAYQSAVFNLRGNHADINPVRLHNKLTLTILELKNVLLDRQDIVKNFNRLALPITEAASEKIRVACKKLTEIPKRVIKSLGKQSKLYFEQRTYYLQELEKIAKECNKYLIWIRADHNLRRVLVTKEQFYAEKNINEGLMWKEILQNAEEDVSFCFKSFADHNPLIPIETLKKQLKEFKQAILWAKKNGSDNKSTEIIPIKNYDEFTLEDLRQSYLKGVQMQLSNLKKMAIASKNANVIANADAFCNNYNSWLSWIPVFIFDLFNISDPYRPIEAKSIDALRDIQTSIQEFQCSFINPKPIENPKFRRDQSYVKQTAKPLFSSQANKVSEPENHLKIKFL